MEQNQSGYDSAAKKYERLEKSLQIVRDEMIDGFKRIEEALGTPSPQRSQLSATPDLTPLLDTLKEIKEDVESLKLRPIPYINTPLLVADIKDALTEGHEAQKDELLEALTEKLEILLTTLTTEQQSPVVANSSESFADKLKKWW